VFKLGEEMYNKNISQEWHEILVVKGGGLVRAPLLVLENGYYIMVSGRKKKKKKKTE